MTRPRKCAGEEHLDAVSRRGRLLARAGEHRQATRRLVKRKRLRRRTRTELRAAVRDLERLRDAQRYVRPDDDDCTLVAWLGQPLDTVLLVILLRSE